jgi:hypothetical protein
LVNLIKLTVLYINKIFSYSFHLVNVIS